MAGEEEPNAAKKKGKRSQEIPSLERLPAIRKEKGGVPEWGGRLKRSHL